MGFVEFSSGDVNYIFQGVNHFLARIQDGIFRGIDALVIEKFFGIDFAPDGWGERFLFPSLFGTKRLVQQLKEERTPVYCVDVATEHSDAGFFLMHRHYAIIGTHLFINLVKAEFHLKFNNIWVS